MYSLISKILPVVEAAGWSDPTGEKPTQLSDLNFIFERILNIATGFAVFIVFAMLVVGGFKYITSGGDQKAAGQAKNTITYAIIGIVTMIGIWLILKFISVFTGVDVTKFRFGN